MRKKSNNRSHRMNRQKSAAAKLSRTLARVATASYVLRLYVTGITPLSMRAIDNVKKLCEEHLEGRYELDIIDLYQQPQLAEGAMIVAAPTLVKKLPLPLRRMIGDMSDTSRMLVGLDLRKKTRPRLPVKSK